MTTIYIVHINSNLHTTSLNVSYFRLQSNKEGTKTVTCSLEYESVNVQDQSENAIYEVTDENEGLSLAPCEAYGLHSIKKH